ncbi:MAG TPA: hypothetical protein VNR38_13960 [Ureibacillus sp.]|nr:hypothetical protein [Ureibacillus sp.]
MNQPFSKFETYLLDQEQGFEVTELNVSITQDVEINNLEEYPAGFFTSL